MYIEHPGLRTSGNHQIHYGVSVFADLVQLKSVKQLKVTPAVKMLLANLTSAVAASPT
jgi:hypothetical protein